MKSSQLIIIESLTLDDEAHDRFEGHIIANILKLGGIKTTYFYIRTKRELKNIIKRISKDESTPKYLHISCHGLSNGIQLTFDQVNIQELPEILSPLKSNKRAFFSACEVVNMDTAKILLNKNNSCISILGPSGSPEFDRAAIFWSSFYHIVMKSQNTTMGNYAIKRISKQLSTLYTIPIAIFIKRKDGSIGCEKFK